MYIWPSTLPMLNSQGVAILINITRNMPFDLFNNLSISGRVGLFTDEDETTIFPEYRIYRDRPECNGMCILIFHFVYLNEVNFIYMYKLVSIISDKSKWYCHIFPISRMYYCPAEGYLPSYYLLILMNWWVE